MLKNTYLIKENYKKVEEVREIETKVLSCDEFLDNYNQEQVNYEDLTHENISSNKGYGPCSWANPGCTCYADQRFISLMMACPSCSAGITPTMWFHSGGGYLAKPGQGSSCGTLLISGQGSIKCAVCGKNGY
jgi:hypothetical protein